MIGQQSAYPLLFDERDGVLPRSQAVAFNSSVFRPRGLRGFAPGHGPHHYRFQVFALSSPIPDTVTTHKLLLPMMAGQCRGQRGAGRNLPTHHPLGQLTELCDND
jgi:hypothetical protein